MLEELSVKNFLSFKGKETMSFEATSDDFGEGNLVAAMPDGKRLLRFAMIYGANASGKTNVLVALDTIKRFWTRTPDDIDKPTGMEPFRFDVATPSEPSEFTLRFYVDGVRYWYVLRLDTKHIIEEKLSYYMSNRPTMLFHRKIEDGRLNLMINNTVLHVTEVERQQIQINCFDNMSFFAARKKVNIVLPEIDLARKWMLDQVMHPVLPGQSMFEYAKNQVEKDASLVPYLLEKMNSADFNITGLQTERKPSDYPQEIIREIREDKDSSEEEKNDIFKHIGNQDYVIALDINGEELDSISLAKKIDNTFLTNSTITFIIGSSYGLHNDAKRRANYRMSFSKMTFPHGLFRGILLEQIYRSFKILNNESYHK